MNNIVLKNKSIKTEIIIKNNFIFKYFNKLIKIEKKIFCVVDTNLKNIIKPFVKNKNIKFYLIDGGERIKNIKTYNYLCEKLLSDKIDRHSILIGLGGGTVGDLTGFMASTILRGIEFKLIPSTLLSQVDSSIGGKNGINSQYGKNLIGSFYHPNEVVIDVDLLKTLPKRQIKSGYSEIVKHALISDKKFFNWLEKNYHKLIDLKKGVVEKAILNSIMIKWKYVNLDPKEKLINSSSRSMLNFGHTFGHALETFYKYKNISHGEAISVGMIVESFISNKLGYLKDSEYEMILNHFRKAKLKVLDKNIKNNSIIEILLKDKKNFNNKINIVLLKKIGNSFFSRNHELIEIKRIIKNI